jgi:hypothetical protein
MTQRHRLGWRRRRRLLKKFKCGFEFSYDFSASKDASPIEHLKEQPLGVEKARYQIGNYRI